jgi:hypothetical protein
MRWWCPRFTAVCSTWKRAGRPASAARQTIKPVLMAIVFLAIARFIFQQLAPDTHSIRAVWRDLLPLPTQR